MIIIWTRKINRTFIWDGVSHQPNVGVWEKSTSFKSLFFHHSSSFHFPAMDKKIWGVRRLVARKTLSKYKSVIVARRFFRKSLFSRPDIFVGVCNHGFPEWTSNIRYLQTEWMLIPIRCHLLWSRGYYCPSSGLWIWSTQVLLCCAGACDHGGETGFWFRDGKSFPGSPGLFSLHIFFQSDFG